MNKQEGYAYTMISFSLHNLSNNGPGTCSSLVGFISLIYTYFEQQPPISVHLYVHVVQSAGHTRMRVNIRVNS